MKENLFIELRRVEWEAWDRWLHEKAKRGKRGHQSKAVSKTSQTQEQGAQGGSGEALADLPAAYRRLCQDLSLARDRNYSSLLIQSLHDRVLAAHQRLYVVHTSLIERCLAFLMTGLPRLVRQEKSFVLASACLLFAPFFLTLILLQWYPDGIYLFMSAVDAASFKEMYSPNASHLGKRNAATGQVTMLAFYIANNVQINFQCFAGGIFFGLGSVFYLIYNGLFFGAVAGYLTQGGYVETFWGFVAGHSAPELIGAVLSGAAGLKIGLALIAPGRLRRLDALKDSARAAVPLLYGAALLTFSAAFIEAFWSPHRTLPFELKLAVGALVWVVLLAYLIFFGRRIDAA